MWRASPPLSAPPAGDCAALSASGTTRMDERGLAFRVAPRFMRRSDGSRRRCVAFERVLVTAGSISIAGGAAPRAAETAATTSGSE